MKQMTQDHYGWLKVQKLKQLEKEHNDSQYQQSQQSMLDITAATQHTSEVTPNSIQMNDLVAQIERKRNNQNNQTYSQVSGSGKKSRRTKALNGLFLSQLGDEEIVQPILSNEKEKKKGLR